MLVEFKRDYLPWGKGQTANLEDNIITQELIQRGVCKHVLPNQPKSKKVDSAPKNKALE